MKVRFRLNDASGERADVESVAARWAIRSSEGALGVDEQRELDEWLAGGSARLGAFVRAQAVWMDVDRIVALDSGSRAVPDTHLREPLRWRRYAIAASLAIAMLSGGVAYDHLAGRVSTDRDEVRRLVLEDGSTIFLNGDSVVQVRYGKDARRILLRRGEASFRVAHNKTRPFIVTAADVSVTAVGTEFSVDRDENDVAVTVSQGVVKLDDKSSDVEERHILRRNQQFVAAASGSRRTELPPAEVGRQLAWRDGLLVFEGQPLGVAADEVSRYSNVRVVIDDPTLARAEFMGVFHIGDARAFANAAAQAFNGEVTEDEGTLRLSRKQDSPSH